MKVELSEAQLNLAALEYLRSVLSEFGKSLIPIDESEGIKDKAAVKRVIALIKQF